MVLLHPLLQDGQQAQGFHLVAHQVVVGKEHGSTKPGGQQRIELAAQLLRSLGARVAAEHLDDVAELAVEGTTPTPLHGQRVVGLDVEEIVAWWGQGMKFGAAGRGQARGQVGSACQRFAQGRHQLLGLTRHDTIRIRREQLGASCSNRSPDHNHFARGPRLRRQLEQRVALDQHPGQENRVRPVQFIRRQRLHVQVAEADLPVLGQQRGHREQPQRGQQRPLAHQPEGVLMSPVGAGKGRVEAQDFHQSLTTVSVE